MNKYIILYTVTVSQATYVYKYCTFSDLNLLSQTEPLSETNVNSVFFCSTIIKFLNLQSFVSPFDVIREYITDVAQEPPEVLSVVIVFIAKNNGLQGI